MVVATDKTSGLEWDYLVDKFDIFPETGEVYWRNAPGKRASMLNGTLAGDLNHKFEYVMIGLRGKQYKRHRLVWFSVYKKWPKEELDHIDGVKKNDSIFNLREATKQQNSLNKGVTKRSKSGRKGICFDKLRNKWRVTLRPNQKTLHIGRFDTIEAAQEAYNAAVAKYCGEFGRAS